MRLFGSLAALVVLSAYCVSAQGVIYSYDSAGRLMSANYGAAGTVTYTCDAAGRLITRAAPAPVLAIAKSHSGNFTQGQTGAYTITVSNTGNGPTNAAVQVSDTLPAGLTAASVQTTGWTCAIGPPVACNRSDALGATASYAAITVMVNVAANAPASVTNTATVSGGGAAAGATANDATYINPGGAPAWKITKTHTGNFTQGQAGATYTITVSNTGAVATSGAAQVSDTLPTGLTAASVQATGWTCSMGPPVSCSRSDPLAAGGSYAAITVMVNVAANAPASVTNTASISGAGIAGTSANDPTTINPAGAPVYHITKTHSGNFTQGQNGAVYTITVSNTGTAPTAEPYLVLDYLPAGLNFVSAQGTNWNCGQSLGNDPHAPPYGAVVCGSQTDAAPGTSFAPITVTVNVGPNAPASVTNSAVVQSADYSVNNPGSVLASASDPTTINPSGPLTPPTPVSVSPAAGSTSGSTYTFVFTDPRGYQDMNVVDILVNNFLDGRSACYLAYVVGGTYLLLVDDGGHPGGPYAGRVTLGSSAAIQNSQCSATLVSATGSGNNLTLVLTIAWSATFGGDKIIHMAGGDVLGNNSGWQRLGVWRMPGAASTGTIAVVGMTPNQASGLGPAAYTFNFSDTAGFANLRVENILINDFINGISACYLAYIRDSNTLLLVNDAGNPSGPFAGNSSLGAPGSMQNSQCVVSWGANPVTGSGNNLAVTLNIAFLATFDGNRVFYVAARDVNDLNNTDWHAMGTQAVKQ